MRVPVRRLPQTRISEQQRVGARAAPALDVTPITETIEGFRKQLLDEQYDRQKFAASKRLMDEINDLTQDFEERRRDPEQSPVDFADNTETAYRARHQALLQELRDEDFDQEILDDLDLRLGSVRQGFYAKGMEHQLVTLRGRALTSSDDIIDSTSRYVANDYNNYNSSAEMLRESISVNPDLLETDREAKIEQGLGVLRDAGGKAMAIQAPQLVIEKLDPLGLTAPYRAPATATGGGAVNVEGLDADRGAVATTLTAGGLSAPVVAGFLGNFDVEGGYGGALGDKGTASGIAQWRKERRDNFKRKFGKEPHEATKEEQAQFVLWELDNPAEAGMTPQQVAEIKSAETAEEAARLIDEYYERSDKKHQSRRMAAASGYASVGEVAPAATVEPAGASALAPSTAPPEVVTGIPLLDAMNGAERLQVLAMAREQMNKVNASRKAEMDVTIGNITAEALNNGGEIATPLPTQEDVLAVYGPVEGPQRWAQIQQSKDTGKAITTFRTQSAETIQRSLDAIKPKPGSPTYETELQIYSAAERAANQLLKEREDDPAAYAIKYFPSVRSAMQKGTAEYYAELDRVYETLGINASRAPLLTEDAARQITDDYKTMSPAQRLNFMRENYTGMGEDRFRRFVAGMEGTTAQEDARIYMLLRTYGQQGKGWPLIYQQILEGREVMDKDPARRPSTEKLNEQFRTEALNAINNLHADASRSIQEAAAAIYVARNGNPVEINSKLYQEALATALGGNLPVYMGSGEVKDFTILPPRVNEPQFRQWIERQTFETLTHRSLDKRPPRYGDLKTLAQTEDIVDHGVFVMVAPGWYKILMATDGLPLVTSQGRTFLVNVQAPDVLAPAPAAPRRPYTNPGLDPRYRR